MARVVRLGNFLRNFATGDIVLVADVNCVQTCWLLACIVDVKMIKMALVEE